MIDLHCHLLPGLDDGPGALDGALAMARCAAADGIRCVVATPHVNGWDGRLRQAAGAACVALQRELNVQGIPLTVHCGAEINIAPEMLQAPPNDRAWGLNGSRYVLLEMPLTDYPLYADEVIFALQLRGLVPILAHPERNAALQAQPERLLRLIERGALGQLTADSLLSTADRGTRTMAERCLEHGLVHVLASDGHDATRRPPRLAAAVQAAAQIVGIEAAEAMVRELPEAILADRPVDVPEPRPLSSRSGRHWWQWGGRKD